MTNTSWRCRVSRHFAASPPWRKYTNEDEQQGIGERVRSEVTRDEHLAVLVDHSTIEGGEVKPKRPAGGKGEAGHNVLMEGKMGDTQRSQTVSTKLHQIAEQARDKPERVFTSLAHLMDVAFLLEAYRKTRKDGATGVDGITAKVYCQSLEDNLKKLHSRMRVNRYKAPPVKRGWIEKEDNNKQRPLGMPTLEDKIVQRAVSMTMMAVKVSMRE